MRWLTGRTPKAVSPKERGRLIKEQIRKADREANGFTVGAQGRMNAGRTSLKLLRKRKK